MHQALIALATVLGSLTLSNSTVLSATPPITDHVEIDVEFNVFTEAPNHWRATGAIEDEGTIKHDHSEVFRGSTAAVTDSPEGGKGSFTWTFHRTFTRDFKFPDQFKSSGGWRMVGGTGAYENISGQGTMTGSLNLVTGELRDHFVGKVTLPEE